MNENIILELNLILSNIEVKYPLRKLLNPQMKFLTNPDGSIDLSVKIDTWERDTGNEFLELESRHPVNEHWKARFRNKPKNMAQFVHVVLLRTLEHELNESIWIDEERVFEPNHWGPKNLNE
jgi:hypothetical protein